MSVAARDFVRQHYPRAYFRELYNCGYIISDDDGTGHSISNTYESKDRAWEDAAYQIRSKRWEKAHANLLRVAKEWRDSGSATLSYSLYEKNLVAAIDELDAANEGLQGVV